MDKYKQLYEQFLSEDVYGHAFDILSDGKRKRKKRRKTAPMILNWLDQATGPVKAGVYLFARAFEYLKTAAGYLWQDFNAAAPNGLFQPIKQAVKGLVDIVGSAVNAISDLASKLFSLFSGEPAPVNTNTSYDADVDSNSEASYEEIDEEERSFDSGPISSRRRSFTPSYDSGYDSDEDWYSADESELSNEMGSDFDATPIIPSSIGPTLF